MGLVGYYLLINAMLAAGLAACAWWVCLRVRSPAIHHLLWVMVLVRLIMPPVLCVDLTRHVQWVASLINDAPAKPTADRPEQPIWPIVHEAARVLHEGWSPIRQLGSVGVPPALQTPNVAAQPNKPSVWAGWRRIWPEQQRQLQLVGRYLFPCWVLTTLAWLAWQAWSIRRFRQQLATCSYASRIWQQRTRQLARRLGLRRCPPLLLVRAPISPMLWGLGKRTQILFPESLLESLGRQAQDALLLHELSHYRRRDQWVRVLELAATAVFWWHPVLWWARAEIETAEERCCDALAVRQANGPPRRYAEALLAVVNFVSRRALPPVASGATRCGLVRLRLETIMRPASLAGCRLTPDRLPAMLLVALPVLVPYPSLQVNELVGANMRPMFALRPAMQTAAKEASDDDVVQQGEGIAAVGSDERLATPDLTDRLVSPCGGYRLERDAAQRSRLLEIGSAGEVVRKCDLGVARVACVAFSNDDRMLAVGTTSGVLEVRDCASGGVLRTLQVGHRHVTAVCFSPDGQSVAVACGSRCQLVSLTGRRESEVVRYRPMAVARGLSYSADGQQMVVAWSELGRHSLERWDLVAGRIATRRQITGELRAAMWLGPSQLSRLATEEAVRTSDDGGWLLAFGDGSVAYCSPDLLLQPVSAQLPERILNGLSFSPAGLAFD